MLMFVIQNISSQDKVVTFDLQGYKGDYVYALKVVVSKDLNSNELFQGAGKTKLVPIEGTQNVLRAMADAYNLKDPGSPMKNAYEPFETILLDGKPDTLEGGYTRLKLPIGDEGAELVVELNVPQKTATLTPRTDEQGVLDVLAGV